LDKNIAGKIDYLRLMMSVSTQLSQTSATPTLHSAQASVLLLFSVQVVRQQKMLAKKQNPRENTVPVWYGVFRISRFFDFCYRFINNAKPSLTLDRRRFP